MVDNKFNDPINRLAIISILTALLLFKIVVFYISRKSRRGDGFAMGHGYLAFAAIIGLAGYGAYVVYLHNFQSDSDNN